MHYFRANDFGVSAGIGERRGMTMYGPLWELYENLADFESSGILRGVIACYNNLRAMMESPWRKTCLIEKQLRGVLECSKEYLHLGKTYANAAITDECAFDSGSTFL